MVELTLNGQPVALTGLPPETPLLWALRDHLKLRGTKFGCGRAQCGTCTVHLDGRATRSCMLPISTLEGRSVTTIEGLSERGDHPLQKAWVAHGVPQCGFCQTGQLMTAAALLAENASPDEDEVRAALSGNLCRCGTYNRILAAVQTAAEELR